MKNYDIEIYRMHLRDLPKNDDPFKIETYIKGVLDLANGFNTEEQASGVLDKNDLVQECYLALLEAWENMNWDAIRASDEPQARIWAYLKKSIKLKARERVHNKKDGIRIPHGKRWEIQETKNVDDFLTQLFPPEFFSENAETMGWYDDNQITRYDVEQLGIGLDDVMRKYLSSKEQLILEYYFGVDRDQISTKEISKRLDISVSNVKWTKFNAIQKLQNEEVRDYLKDFYYFD